MNSVDNKTYHALCQIIGEYYHDAMSKDEHLRKAMQYLCQLRDKIYPRWDARRFHPLGQEATEEYRAKDYVVSLVEHHSVTVEANSADEAKEKAREMWDRGDLALDAATFIELEITDVQALEEG